MKLQGSWLKENLLEATNAVKTRPQWMKVGFHATAGVTVKSADVSTHSTKVETESEKKREPEVK